MLYHLGNRLQPKNNQSFFRISFLVLLILAISITSATPFSQSTFQSGILQSLYNNKGNKERDVQFYKPYNPNGEQLFDQEFKCGLCKTGSFALERSLLTDNAKWVINKASASLCIFSGTNVTECQLTFALMSPIIVETIAKAYLSPDYLCIEILPFCLHSDYKILTSEDFAERVLAGKPDIIKDNNYVNNLYKKIEFTERKTLKVVQITDTHVDFKYAVGSDALCNGIFCCRDYNGYPNEPERQAGEWGSYQCDIPVKSFESMLQFINQDIKPDIMFWTGDNMPHDIWQVTNEEASEGIVNVTKLIQKEFKDSNTIVYPVHGNHDLFPANCQDFTEPSKNSQVQALNEAWSEWLEEDAVKQHSKWGYYSQILKLKNGTEFNNTYIIAINTITCYIYNWYLLINRNDPADEIEWLETLLSDIEKKGGQAIIISHIPGHFDCLQSWSHRFRALQDRYQHVIRFAVFGHTHVEEFMVTKSLIDDKNILVNHIGGSVTTYLYRNPSFTVIEIDEEYMIPLNFKTYYMNITKANLENKPTWELMVDYKEDYGLEFLSPDHMYKLAEKIRDDEESAIEFQWNRVKRGEKKLTTCDRNCRRERYCYLISVDYASNQLCKGRQVYDIFHEPAFTVLNLLNGEWTKEVDDPEDLDY